MRGLELDPQRIREELASFNRRLQESCQTLGDIDTLDVAPTPCETIFRNDGVRLNYYPPASATRVKTPLLICYALVNRPYILDLQPDRSLIAELGRRGIPVYLIDWGYPDEGDRFLDLEDYIEDYLESCVAATCAHAGSAQVNLLGVCQGGTLSLCHAALHPQRTKNLLLMVTPVDFHCPGFLLSHLAGRVDVDLAVETWGNIPGRLLNDAYSSLMPMRLGVRKNLGLPEQLNSREKALNFLRMERWINDCPDQAGEAFRSFISQFFQQNLLLKGEVRIGDRRVDLGRIKQPILNLIGRQDHLVPPASSQALAGATASRDYQQLELQAGHIGIFVSRRALEQVPDQIAQWLCARD